MDHAVADGDRSDEHPLGSNEPLALERIVFFSDAVMAIAITLLAIDLRLPDVSGVDSAAYMRMLVDLVPRYFAFAMSFAVIGVYWAAHHRMFRSVVRWDRGLMALNLLFLFFVVQLPFVSASLGDYGDLPVATAVYAVLLSLMGFSSYALWMHCVRRRLVSEEVTPAFARYVALRAVAVAVVFAISVPLAFISPLLAEMSWLATTGVLFVISRFAPNPLNAA